MTLVNKRKMKRKINPVVPYTSKKYKVGDEVIGIRSPNAYTGTLIEMTATVNTSRFSGRTYNNAAFKIKCNSDGKIRSFQSIRHQSNDDQRVPDRQAKNMYQLFS